MTKEMKEKCLNTKMQAFCALDKDVQEAITAVRRVGDVEWLITVNNRPQWERMGGTHTSDPNSAAVYRVRPDYPVELSYIEVLIITPSDQSAWISSPKGATYSLSNVMALPRLAGIIYEKDGVETLRPHLSLDFGVPKRVRFYTE